MRNLAFFERRCLLSAALLPAFALAACGSDSVQRPTPSPGAPTPPPTSTPAPTPDPTPSPSPTPPAAPAGYYDTAIGAGVDIHGFTHLPLRQGAKRYFVNSTTGSDDNSCAAAESPTTPKKTVRQAVGCITDVAGAGDQIMIAEGTSYAGGPQDISYKFGHSPMYPTVIQSYDPADPFNELKHGRATGNKRPVLNTERQNTSNITSAANTPNFSHFAIRGLDWNPGNTSHNTLEFLGGNDYILVENNIFRHTALSLNGGNGRKVRHIVRRNAFYGTWSATTHAGGVFEDDTAGVTIEDNIFAHLGWRPGGSRDDSREQGGATMFNQSIYLSLRTWDAVTRRNVFVDPAASAITMRGDAKIHDNVIIDAPLGMMIGFGDNYAAGRPEGIMIEIYRNLHIGDADINSSNPRGTAIQTANGKPGSYVRDNLVLHSRNMNGVNTISFTNGAVYDLPSFVEFANNIIYKYSYVNSGTGGAFPLQNLATYENNVWDAPTLGSNTNNAGVTFPNPVGASDIYNHLGCGTKDACVTQMVSRPEENWANRIRNFVFAGYGKSVS